VNVKATPISRDCFHDRIDIGKNSFHVVGLDQAQWARSQRDLALALIVERLIDPAAKLATSRVLDENTAINSLSVTLGFGEVHVNELYATLDWLGLAQTSIEDALARRHLHDGTLLLYDVSSSYVVGCGATAAG
jgi:hypothetical protein